MLVYYRLNDAGWAFLKEQLQAHSTIGEWALDAKGCREAWATEAEQFMEWETPRIEISAHNSKTGAAELIFLDRREHFDAVQVDG